MNLTQLRPGEAASVLAVEPSPLAARLIDLGFLGQVRCIAAAGRGGMRAYLVGGALIALRHSDALTVRVCRLD